MIIQKATTANLNQLITLFNAYRVFYKQVSNLTAAEQFLTERFNKKDTVIFLIFSSEGDAIGFTQLYPSFSSVSMQRVYILNDLYISEEHRGKGAGEALLQHAKQFAISEGAKGLTLETDVTNPAQKLYERLGWEKDTDVFHYTWKA